MCQIARSDSGRDAHERGRRRGGLRASPEPAGDHGHLDACARRSSVTVSRGMSLSHSIAKCGSTSLSAAGQVEPDLEQLERVGAVAIEQREHLAVHDAGAGGQPLHVAAAEAGGGAERVAVVDQALADVGDGLEAAVRVGWEAGHDLAVVHPPAVDALEVLTELAAGERRRRAELGVARGVAVEVVDAEQERVDRLPTGTRAARSAAQRSCPPG